MSEKTFLKETLYSLKVRNLTLDYIVTWQIASDKRTKYVVEQKALLTNGSETIEIEYSLIDISEMFKLTHHLVER